MFMEVSEGMLLLKAIPELEPPANLLHNISGTHHHAEAKGEVAPRPTQIGWLERLRVKLPSPLAGMLHARFATSFCMAFFSISLTLNLLGVRVTDMKHVDWRPTALKRSAVLQYTQVEAKVQRYYDNMRLVLEVEAKVRQLKTITAPAQDNNNNNSNPQAGQTEQETIRRTPVDIRKSTKTTAARWMTEAAAGKNLMPGKAYANPFAKLLTSDEGAQI